MFSHLLSRLGTLGRILLRRLSDHSDGVTERYKICLRPLLSDTTLDSSQVCS